jgi:competence protein ComEC
MCARYFVSSLTAAALLGCGLSCTGNPPGRAEPFTFAVLDVGQGLSQIGVRNTRAVIWDVGPADSVLRWRADYAALGSPAIEAIAISHNQEDHAGAARFLDPNLSFTGRVVVSPFEDTAALRAGFGPWSDRIFFSVKRRGDTVGGLEGVLTECLWPPEDADPGLAADGDTLNRYSFVFRLSFGETSVLITSDIDSAVEHRLCASEAGHLASEVLLVPHHGSSGSVDQLFYGYVDPGLAIISCGADNPYGHPAPELYDIFYRMGISYRTTFESGNVVGKSNGFYWAWQ